MVTQKYNQMAGFTTYWPIFKRPCPVDQQSLMKSAKDFLISPSCKRIKTIKKTTRWITISGR
jgi:hypothetical protein